MAEGDLLMSRSERDRAHVVRQVFEHRLSQREASERLGIGVRQFKRLLRCWRQEGDAGLVSRQRGRASHNRLSANQTLQDRLVKEMRLQNIPSIEAANAFAPAFIGFWNGKFAVAPRDETSAHRLWTSTPQALEDALARHEERVLSKALTFSSAGSKYCVQTKGPGTALRGAKVALYHFVGGGMSVHYKDRVLAVTAYGTYPVPDPAEDEKTIDARVDAIIASRAKPGVGAQPRTPA
jgi:transposase-like protein